MAKLQHLSLLLIINEQIINNEHLYGIDGEIKKHLKPLNTVSKKCAESEEDHPCPIFLAA